MIRKEIHTRFDFARDQYYKMIRGWQSSDSISGKKARKIAQAYRICLHYQKEFNTACNET